MTIRDVRFLIAMLAILIVAALPAEANAEGGADDAFAAMRVERVDPPRSVANLVLRGLDGTPIRLADFKGKVVLVGFLIAN